MKPKLLLRLVALLAVLTVGFTASAQIWVGSQLGNPAHQGYIVTNTDNTLTIEAGGNDIWNTSDNGFYYYTWAQGNFDARVYANSLINSSGYGGSTWSKIEMMVRFSDPAAGPQGNDAFIASMTAPGQPATAGQYRGSRGAGANNAGTVQISTVPPQWLRLTRTNNLFTTWSSTDGTAWDLLQSIDVSAATNGFTGAWPDVVSVGVAVTAHDDGNSVDNYTTANVNAPTISSVGPPWSAPTAAGITRDVADVSAHLAGEASFSCTSTNNAKPTQFTPMYQWYRDDALLPGATGNAYTLLATAADSGAQFKCVSWPEGYESLSVTSSVGTLTVASDSVAYTNGVKLEVFAGSTRAQVEINNTGTGDTGNNRVAGKLAWLDRFEDGGGYGDNTARRYSTWIVPPADGNYTFYVASDDDTDVFLSTDADPANKRIICQEPQWSGYNNWTNAGAGGAGAIAMKCSDTWTNAANPTPPFAGGIPLVGGDRYYVEVVEHNGGGGDNSSLTMLPFGTPGPTNGEPTTLGLPNNNLVMMSYPLPIDPALFVWNPEPSDASVFENFAVTFSGVATSDSEFRPHYQWQRYGTNIAGATGTSYSINAVTLADDGTPFQLIATLPTLIDGASTTISITSRVATLTVIASVFEPGFVLAERWNGVQDIAAARAHTLGTPDFVAAIPALEASINNETGDNYTRRISGFIVFPSNTNVDFYACADDSCALWIADSEDQNDNIHEIARETAWSNPFNWTGSEGGSTVAYKNSATWTNNGTTTPPYVNGISLTANKRYYIELDHQEGTGGDNVEAAVVAHGTIPANGTDYAPAGSLIGIPAPKANWVMFTLQPTNPPPVGAGAASSVDLYAFGTTDSQIAVGSTSANGPNNTEVADQYVFFQWTKNGSDIPGATASHLNLTGLRPSDDQAQIACMMRALGYGEAPNTHYWSNSEIATLTVTNDPTVPQLLAAGAYQSVRDGRYYVSLSFSAPIDPASINSDPNVNFQVTAGGSPASVYSVAWLSRDNRRLLLEVSFISSPVVVSVTGLKSWSQVDLAPANNVTAYELGSQFLFADIGAFDQNTYTQTDPMAPSKLWVEGDNAWTIAATGHDIWDNADGFTFLYETKQGDFDVVVRQTQYGVSSPWAKCGLMAREGINGQIDDPKTMFDPSQAGQSRNWAVLMDPKDVPVVGGTGADQVECGYRYANTNVATGIWWPSPPNVYYTYRPQWPNAWVRLKRVGQTLTAYAGNDGTNWVTLAQTTVNLNTNNPTPLPDMMFVGVAATAHNNAPTADTTDPQYFNYSSVDNYNSSYTGGNIMDPVNSPAVLSAALQDGNIIFDWTHPGLVQLQWSTDLQNWNNFNPRAQTPPVTIQIIQNNSVFYRIRP